MQRTPIEWTHYSVNPFKMRMPDGTLVNVCVHKSDGCRNCYAEMIVRRWWKKEWGEFPGYTAALLKLGTPVLVEDELRAVLRLSERIAKGKADPNVNKVFWNDMTDEYLEFWPDEFIDKCWAIRALTPNLSHQVLTKRIDRAQSYFRGHASGRSRYVDICEAISKLGKEIAPVKLRSEWPLPNVHLGVSLEDQKTADERIPLLLETPAAIRWVSAEPLLGPVDLNNYLYTRYLEGGARHMYNQLDWVVVGGESGPQARPMHPDWARSLRDQCVAAGVPFFFKQWGEYLPSPQNGCSHISSDGAQGPVANLVPQSVDVWRCNICSGLHGYFERTGPYDISFDFKRVGKKVAGRLLDGREWNEYPASQGAAV